MRKTNLNFGNIEVRKSEFHKSKDSIDIDRVNFRKILLKEITIEFIFGI